MNYMSRITPGNFFDIQHACFQFRLSHQTFQNMFTHATFRTTCHEDCLHCDISHWPSQPGLCSCIQVEQTSDSGRAEVAHASERLRLRKGCLTFLEKSPSETWEKNIPTMTQNATEVFLTSDAYTWENLWNWGVLQRTAQPDPQEVSSIQWGRPECVAPVRSYSTETTCPSLRYLLPHISTLHRICARTITRELYATTRVPGVTQH